ncbi:PRTRC system ParB family protein [Marinobacter lutaoensis]|uniref:PRTRC system ParB family protein n=1 Tax=Marinobacter lutaoensis TaxID=135739 RepID=UPI0009FF977C|nr:PRTRC system ParB family protein [Marinobacter lutaoensis]
MTFDATLSQSTTEIAEQASTPNSDTHAEAEEVRFVSPNEIEIIPERNPRRTRSKTEVDEMRESIRRRGVMQSVMVRPNPNPDTDKPYELIAGYTRMALALELGIEKVPALVRQVSDDQILEFAAIENIVRSDMTPMDEGMAARNLMSEGKDADEICKLLGWNPTFLKGRIQLTHCIDEVAQALCDKQINIGHAQLLSGLRPESQKNALAVIVQHNLTVDQLREKIDQLSLRLKAAAFDLTDCATCPHNSSTQTSLFADTTSLAKARCLNKACFEKKTQEHLTSVKAELAESYHKIAFTSEVPTGATTVVVAGGPHGVGEQQAQACTECQHFGALIDNALGSKAAVTEHVCFNLKCHNEKVAAHKNIIATDAQQDQTTSKGETNNDSGAMPAGAKGSNKQSASENGKAKQTKSPAKTAIPKKILEQHHQIHRKAAAETAQNERKLALIGSILCLIRDAKVTLPKTPKDWPVSISDGKSARKAAELLDTQPVEALEKLQTKLVSQMVLKAQGNFGGENEGDVFGGFAHWIAESRQSDLSAYFTMSAEYLSAFTKPMIESRLKAAGFDKHYDQTHGDKAFDALMKGNKGDILKAVKESDFNFSGFIPEGLALSK